MNKRKRYQGTNLNPRTNNNSSIGDISEERVLSLLKTFASISDARRDRYGSKFDIFYELENEDFTRGLQVKTISKASKDTYQMIGMNKYGIGMLVVGIYYPVFGVLHITDESDADKICVCFSLIPRRREKTKYEKEIFSWSDFLIELEKALTNGIIITPEVFKSSVSLLYYREYESIERFKVFCKRYNLKLELVYNVSSPTDLIVNGFKIQMKYSNQPENHLGRSKKGGQYYYRVYMHRNGKVKYLEGDNDFYVIELGENKGHFLWIPEYLLLDKEYISKGELERARGSLSIFPHDHVEKKQLNMPESERYKVKGNWSCNKKYWFSTEKGCLGSTNDVATHIENLLIEEWIDWESPYEPIISK